MAINVDGKSLEELLALPWNTPCFLFLPGRYYLAYGIVIQGKGYLCPHGGNVVGLIWRFDHEPLLWRIQMQTRWYARDDGDPWVNEDRKSWMYTTQDGTKEEVFKKIAGTFEGLGQGLARTQGSPYQAPEWIMLGGDDQVSIKALQNSNAEWLHFKYAKR